MTYRENISVPEMNPERLKLTQLTIQEVEFTVKTLKLNLMLFNDVTLHREKVMYELEAFKEMERDNHTVQDSGVRKMFYVIVMMCYSSLGTG